MKRYRLDLKRGENFEFEIFYKDRNADGREFDINLDGSRVNVNWDVVYYNSDTERLERYIPADAYSFDNSILRNGYILIEMDHLQTFALPETNSNISWNLWVEHSEARFDVASGSIRLMDWERFVDPR